MKKFLLPLLAIVALLVMIAWMAGVFVDKIEPGINTEESIVAPDAVAVEATEVTIIENVPASIEAAQATLISSRLLARIVAVEVRAGDTVSRGDLLIELENSDISAQVQRAEAGIRANTARLNEAGQNLQRVKELQASGVMSDADLDKAQAIYDTFLAEQAGAEQALEEAKTALGYTRITAPFDGRVVDRFAEPGGTAQPGMKLLALYNPLSLRVEAQVREAVALGLEVGQAVQVEVPSLEKIVDAVIQERVPAADPGSRSFLVKAGVTFDKRLLPGMYARLLVPVGKGTQLLIPADRVVHVGQLDLVWVYEDGQRYRRFVRIGQVTQDGRVEILAGLAEGDLVLPLP